MQNNPHKQDIIQELRGKRQDVTELCTEAEAVNDDRNICVDVRQLTHIQIETVRNNAGASMRLIDALTQVCVDLDASTEDFYKVRTSDGVEGFCMRKYIALSK